MINQLKKYFSLPKRKKKPHQLNTLKNITQEKKSNHPNFKIYNAEEKINKFISEEKEEGINIEEFFETEAQKMAWIKKFKTEIEISNTLLLIPEHSINKKDSEIPDKILLKKVEFLKE